jgi:hypothetical protein
LKEKRNVRYCYAALWVRYGCLDPWGWTGLIKFL